MDIEGIKHKAELPGGFDDDFDGLRIVTVGRLNLQKSFDVSIDAMKFIKDAGIRARWYVLGEGDQREFLESRIDMLGLKEDFILLGNRANPYPYVKQCDLYVHASKFEGKSIAIQEARILGKPIVVTDCSGNREQINDGMDGRICDFDSNAIAETVIEMLKDKDKATQMGIAAANRILEEEKNSADLQKLINLLA